MSKVVELTKQEQQEQLDQLLSRKGVAARWRVCNETVKRRQHEGKLRPIYFNQRLLRYRLSDVLQIEREASNGGPLDGKKAPLKPAAKPLSKATKPPPGKPTLPQLTPRIGFNPS